MFKLVEFVKVVGLHSCSAAALVRGGAHAPRCLTRHLSVHMHATGLVSARLHLIARSSACRAFAICSHCQDLETIE